MGVAVNNHVRPVAFLNQRLALQHAKLMLFIHDRQAQTFECHAFLNQGVRADSDLDVPGCEASDLVCFRHRFVTASKQRRVDTETVQKRTEIPIVLFSENFCGGHQCRLIPGSAG